MQLAESLIPSLSTLEVTVRNAVHNTLTVHTGSEFWFKPVLHSLMFGNVMDLVSRLTRRQGHPPTIGKVISEITFGF
jgi:hypothetical protein